MAQPCETLSCLPDAQSLFARIGALARKALELEAGAEPKPGLVCPRHNGAHKDMTHATFMASAAALEPYFAHCALLGHEHGPKPAAQLLPALRAAGCEAERAMFAATNGVNTHKGAVFSLGLLCAACGRLAALGRHPQPPYVAKEAAAFVPGIVEADLGPLKASPPDRKLTAGERLYLEHGIAGVRGEAEQGFPTALAAYGDLRRLDRDLPPGDALPHTLLRLMAVMPDTNLLSRGGPAGLAFVRGQARIALDKGGLRTVEGRNHTLWLRDECTKRNLSPGGSADMLALVAFFMLLAEAGMGLAQGMGITRDG